MEWLLTQVESGNVSRKDFDDAGFAPPRHWNTGTPRSPRAAIPAAPSAPGSPPARTLSPAKRRAREMPVRVETKVCG